MTSRQKQTISILALALVAVWVIYFLSSRNQTGPVSTEPPSNQAVTKIDPPVLSKESVVLPSDFKWDDQDEAWLEELMEQVQPPEDRHSRWNYEFDQTLRPGETLITDGWEVSDGVFRFTSLTPSKVISGGETLYQISAEITEVNLGGEVETLGMPRILTRNGNSATIQSVVHQAVLSSGEPVGEPKEGFQLEVTPEGVTGGIRLSGFASASARKP